MIVFVPKLSTLSPLPDACVLLTTCTCIIGCNIAWCRWKPNSCTASCKYRKYTNNFRLTSVEVLNYSINWSKASFDFLIADIQENDNVLHICWLCCNNTSNHLGWHAKEGAFVIWFWSKPIWLDALIFRKSLHKELQFCLFKHSMPDRLVEPKHSAPNLYASDYAQCQIAPWASTMAALT